MSKSTSDSIQSLQNSVETKLGFEITCTRDCEVLAQEMIRFDRRFALSLSTLRRLFGLVKSNNPPSLTTLNSLARYTGASSYSQWVLNNSNQNSSNETPEASSSTTTLTTNNLASGFLCARFHSHSGKACIRNRNIERVRISLIF